MPESRSTLPKLGLLYMTHVLRFFDRSNFKSWPDRIEHVTYRWGNDKQRFIDEVKRKKIEVLIGNVPATAYETFREIARALPGVRFVPSLDTQFSNKSKENVTHFCHKYDLPVPDTKIFYDLEQADLYLQQSEFPKIIKRSYGPSNYGGYYVHKVDSYDEAITLLNKKRYLPAYVQDFVPMKADIRVMLIGHKPVCAFWRRPPEGEWLTNTSQGGSMDYQDVPQEALDIAVAASQAANAEYWACDIALGHDDQFRILECATAFAAFPYIRDWIGQYLCWHFSDGKLRQPHIPDYNWEELGKISTHVLRTLRHVNFSSQAEVYPQTDGGEMFEQMTPRGYPILSVQYSSVEEWPSETWNFQDLLGRKPKSATHQQAKPVAESSEDVAIVVTASHTAPTQAEEDVVQAAEWAEEQVRDFLLSISGIGNKTAEQIIGTLTSNGVVQALREDPMRLTQVKSIKQKKLDSIVEQWHKVDQSLS
ncbi:hypothetical protein K0504_17375 [Neiella marina]|uniref:ATP-grasp fold RimK-type domain-containing protein n=1 Tax=Neiella holothuriorum TaxID=2870530 RepID=A0ABS7EKC8_9GAMM|nr:helix-hairpin-helix domain-containing protein [Neiella holothuriorum]MBW8192812.1 hypothetical protein [Neiella holothuriorum]